MLLAGLLAVAEAAPASLPPGWKLDGLDLVWTSDTPLRMGGARYEFRSGARLLGYPVQDGNRLRLQRAAASPLSDLAVWAAGRRIDGPIAPLRIAPVAPAFEPPLAVTTADPSVPGPYGRRRLRYRLPDLAVPEFPAQIEVLAEVTAPVGRADAMPLVLFLHGRHSTCFRGGADGRASGDWPCPEGWRPVPSHTGYRYIADLLASQGYLVVSISANGINGQDGLFMDGGAFARSLLIRHHLAQWAEWSAHGGDPWEGLFQGRVNLNEVVLVGHSRGGEGVERAAIDSDPEDPWQIQGLVLIGPTAFGRQVAAGIHTTVILPFCDGDVSDLQGQQYVDIGRDLTRDRALRSSVMAMGTNHNYYNTEWTPGLSQSPAWDDWFDPGDAQCGENRDQRLSPDEQQAVGLAYTAALVDLAVGDGVPIAAACSMARASSPRSIGRANAFVHASGGNKRLLYAAGRGARGRRRSGLSTRGAAAISWRGRSTCVPDARQSFLPVDAALVADVLRRDGAGATRARVAWQQAGGSLEIPVRPQLGGRATRSIPYRGRAGAPPVEFDVRVRDASGAWVALGRRPGAWLVSVGRSPLGKVVARQVRVDLGAAGRGRLRDVTAVELIPVRRADASGCSTSRRARQRLAASDAIDLPRVSVCGRVGSRGRCGDITVEPADRDRGDGDAAGATLGAASPITRTSSSRRVASGSSCRPGATSATVPYHLYRPTMRTTRFRSSPGDAAGAEGRGDRRLRRDAAGRGGRPGTRS